MRHMIERNDFCLFRFFTVYQSNLQDREEAEGNCMKMAKSIGILIGSGGTLSLW